MPAPKLPKRDRETVERALEAMLQHPETVDMDAWIWRVSAAAAVCVDAPAELRWYELSRVVRGLAPVTAPPGRGNRDVAATVARVRHWLETGE
jgi:hypothetical protein